MKATLEFELPEERSEFETANRGGEYASALHDIKQVFRSFHKHTDQTPEDIAAAFQAIEAIVSEVELEW